MTERSNAPLNSLSYRKSNELVSAKYKSTLLENQVMAVALTRIEVNGDDENAPLVASLYPGELKRLIGDPSHIYRTLKSVSKTMTGHTMVLEDGNGNFAAFPVVDDAEYKDGIFTVRFHERIRKHILDLDSRYTTLELSVMTNFKKSSSFRLYEILKSHIYKSKKNINDGRVEVEYNIAELRFMIGLANSDDAGVKNEMARMGDNINWDILFNKLDKKDKKYEKWAEFERNVLKPAQEELKATSDIGFDYEGMRDGRKMSRILFSIYKNVPENMDVINERQQFLEANNKRDRQYEMPRDLPAYKHLYQKYVGHNKLTAEDIDMLIVKAKYDASLVENAINDADKIEYIYNYVGWLVKYVENGGYEKIDVINGSSKDADRVKEVQKSLEEDRDEVAKRYWQKCKEKEEFEQFKMYLENTGEIFNLWDTLYGTQEKCQMFVDWYKNNKADSR